MMTATEMEDVLRNLDRRLTNVEQILPTLATKEDLKAFATREEIMATFATREEVDARLDALRTKMEDLFLQAKTHASALFERTQEQLEIIATHVADISQRLPPRA
jgi:hypothetical protein